MSRRLLWALVVALIVAGTTTAVIWQRSDPPSGGTDRAGPGRSTGTTTTPPTTSPSGSPTTDPTARTVRIATFNVLGAGHTRPRGSDAHMRRGPKRTVWAMRLLERHRIEIAGLQEFETPQVERFNELAGDRWAAYPGDRSTPVAGAQSIIWRADRWRLVEAHLIDVPYFSGNTRPNPYVLLEHRRTGQRVWVWNTHNPADVRGPAERARMRGYRQEARLINRLRRADPEIPVVSLGDKNLGGDYLCALAGRVTVRSADGGHAGRGGRCHRPPDPIIDWIVATPDVDFTGYRRIERGLVERVTDHRLVFADAALP